MKGEKITLQEYYMKLACYLPFECHTHDNELIVQFVGNTYIDCVRCFIEFNSAFEYGVRFARPIIWCFVYFFAVYGEFYHFSR